MLWSWKEETETAGFCILRGKDKMNLDKIIKIFSKMFSFVHPAFHESFFKRNPCIQGVNLGRTRKTLVNNVFWVRLRKNSVSSRGLEQIIQQCFFKRTPLRTSFSIFVGENTIANRAKKSPTLYVVVVGMFFSTLMKTNEMKNI